MLSILAPHTPAENLSKASRTLGDYAAPSPSLRQAVKPFSSAAMSAGVRPPGPRPMPAPVATQRTTKASLTRGDRIAILGPTAASLDPV